MDDHAAVLQRQDTLPGTEDIEDFLDRLVDLAAATLSGLAGTWIECAVILKHGNQPGKVAASSPWAGELNHRELRAGEGPCSRALTSMEPQLLDDSESDMRWLGYRQQLAERGVRTSLAVPVEISEDACAVLNFLGPQPRIFTPDLLNRAAAFAELAGNALRLLAGTGSAQARARNLEAAMRSRTAIDVACGIIMAQNGCTQKEAMDILTRVSSNRNHKLRDVAADLVSKLSGTGVLTHFD